MRLASIIVSATILGIGAVVLTHCATSRPAAQESDNIDPAAQAAPQSNTAVGGNTQKTDEIKKDASKADTVKGGGNDKCLAADFGKKLGREHFLLGGSMKDSSFAKAPFDIRYQYLAGAVPGGGPCKRCDGCVVSGKICNDSNGCEWWGCWQSMQQPPGKFVEDFIAKTHKAGAVPMFSYYVWFSVAGYVEGGAEIAGLKDGPKVRDYLADYRFMLEKIAQSKVKTIVHLEPDLWAYAQQVNADPNAIPVALGDAAVPECAKLDNTFTGFAKCMLKMARDIAPNALVGYHASSWSSGVAVFQNTRRSLDVVAEAKKSAAFMRAFGAAEADLVVMTPSDRDAGFNKQWLYPNNEKLPNFEQTNGWAEAIGQELGLAPIWWMVPVGHMGMPNKCDQYEDNRLDHFFDHPDDYAAAGIAGIAFGPGAKCMTNAESDGGHFLSRAAKYYEEPRPLLCPGEKQRRGDKDSSDKDSSKAKVFESNPNTKKSGADTKKSENVSVRLISRNKPAFTNDGPTSKVTDGDYLEYVTRSEYPLYVAIKIGPTSASKVLLRWEDQFGWNYWRGECTPGDYTIEISKDSTNGVNGNWKTVATVTGNEVTSRSHAFDFSGYTWVKMVITRRAATSTASNVRLVEIDVFDISDGRKDHWIFLGDSVTAHAFERAYVPVMYEDIISSSYPDYYPAVIAAGHGGFTTQDIVDRLDKLMQMNSHVDYFAIALGTNDAAGVKVENFERNLRQIIDRILAVGATPILARTFYTLSKYHNTEPYAEVCDKLTAEYGLIKGPDFYNIFKGHKDEYFLDSLHPNEAGEKAIQEGWAEAMIAAGLYK